MQTQNEEKDILLTYNSSTHTFLNMNVLEHINPDDKRLMMNEVDYIKSSILFRISSLSVYMLILVISGGLFFSITRVLCLFIIATLFIFRPIINRITLRILVNKILSGREATFAELQRDRIILEFQLEITKEHKYLFTEEFNLHLYFIFDDEIRELDTARIAFRRMDQALDISSILVRSKDKPRERNYSRFTNFNSSSHLNQADRNNTIKISNLKNTGRVKSILKNKAIGGIEEQNANCQAEEIPKAISQRSKQMASKDNHAGPMLLALPHLSKSESHSITPSRSFSRISSIGCELRRSYSDIVILDIFEKQNPYNSLRQLQTASSIQKEHFRPPQIYFGSATSIINIASN